MRFLVLTNAPFIFTFKRMLWEPLCRARNKKLTLGRHVWSKAAFCIKLIRHIYIWPDILGTFKSNPYSVFVAIFLSRFSFLHLLQCQLLKYVHPGTYDILLGTSVFCVDQLQSIKKYILSYYDLLLCYLLLENIVKKNNFKHQV